MVKPRFKVILNVKNPDPSDLAIYIRSPEPKLVRRLNWSIPVKSSISIEILLTEDVVALLNLKKPSPPLLLVLVPVLNL